MVDILKRWLAATGQCLCLLNSQKHTHLVCLVTYSLETFNVLTLFIQRLAGRPLACKNLVLEIPKIFLCEAMQS